MILSLFVLKLRDCKTPYQASIDLEVYQTVTTESSGGGGLRFCSSHASGVST